MASTLLWAVAVTLAACKTLNLLVLNRQVLVCAWVLLCFFEVLHRNNKYFAFGNLLHLLCRYFKLLSVKSDEYRGTILSTGLILLTCDLEFLSLCPYATVLDMSLFLLAIKLSQS